LPIRHAGVIGAAHAGWRGALGRGAGGDDWTRWRLWPVPDRAAITAVIGPTISQRAYEVGPDFLADFLAHDPETARFFAQGAGDRMMFDLPGYGLHRLRMAGIGHAEWTRHCTYSDPARFFSYRRATHAGEADYGRLISSIRL
jgi:polyphenol oxidase